MKRFLCILAIAFAISSCNKHMPEHPHTEVSRDSLLVAKTWQIQHIQALQNNTIFFYERGGQNNNFNYDHDYLKFETGGTGMYQAGSETYTIEWQFDNSSKTEMTYTIHDYANGAPQQGVNLQIKLENVFLSENSFRYAEVYTNDNGTETISSVYREPTVVVINK